MVLMSHPTSATSMTEFVSCASIGTFSGQLVITGMLLFYGTLVGLGVYSYWASRIRKRLPAGHPGRLSMEHHPKAGMQHSPEV